MFKLNIFSYSLLALIFSLSIHSAHSNENQESLSVIISGEPHLLLLKKNSKLFAKTSGADSSKKIAFAASAKNTRHYSGVVGEHKDSWYRISNVDGHWTGLISLNKKIHLIDYYTEAKSFANNSNRLAQDQGFFESGLNALSIQELTFDEPMHCGVVHTNKNLIHKAEQVESHLIFSNEIINKEQLLKADICTDTADGICLVAELEFAFDQLFINSYQSNAQGEAMALINMVEGIYVNDLDVKFQNLTVEFLQNDVFDVTTDSSALLNDIRAKKRDGQISFIKNSRSLFHFVTGRNFDGSTVGIAYVGALCAGSGFSSGTSQLLTSGGGNPNTSRTSLVVAHELGHNFGSDHDGDGNSCNTGFVMSPSVNNGGSSFSSCSIDQITNEISTINNPARCFNFPVDLSIVASNSNPTEVTLNQALTTEYQVEKDDSSFQQASSITVSGTLPANSGSFENVMVSGQACSIDGSATSYTCTIDNPSAPLSLIVNSNPLTSDFEQTHQVSVLAPVDVVDINEANDRVVSTFTVAEVAPVSVSNLQALVNTSGTSDVIDLSWQDNSDNENGFIIQKNINSGNFVELIQLDANASSFTDSDVTAGNSYAYRIIAFNNAGNAVASNQASASIANDPGQVTPPADDDSGGGSANWLLLILLLASFNSRRLMLLTNK